MSPHVPGTSPYPWPFDGDLTGAGTALLVLAPVDADALPAEVANAVALLARALRAAGGAVLVATTTAPARLADRTAAPAGTAGPAGGPDLLEEVAPDLVIAAGGLDAFYASDLDLVLRTRGVVRLLFAGSWLETTVHSTMRDANDRGYECLLVVDACTPVEPDLVPAAVSTIGMSGGIFGAVGQTADVLAALASAHATLEGAPT